MPADDDSAGRAPPRFVPTLTEVAFHFNVPDKLGYACRLLRKAYAAGAPVGVIGAADALAALDTQLWSFSALDFIPHCTDRAPADILARSPIVLASDGARLPPAPVMVHLGTEVPAGFEQCERLIELVGADDADRVSGRRRWRHYVERGCAVRSYDAAGS